MVSKFTRSFKGVMSFIWFAARLTDFKRTRPVNALISLMRFSTKANLSKFSNALNALISFISILAMDMVLAVTVTVSPKKSVIVLPPTVMLPSSSIIIE
jgi:hypothetical protein